MTDASCHHCQYSYRKSTLEVVISHARRQACRNHGVVTAGRVPAIREQSEIGSPATVGVERVIVTLEYPHVVRFHTLDLGLRAVI